MRCFHLQTPLHSSFLMLEELSSFLSSAPNHVLKRARPGNAQKLPHSSAQETLWDATDQTHVSWVQSKLRPFCIFPAPSTPSPLAGLIPSSEHITTAYTSKHIPKQCSHPIQRQFLEIHIGPENRCEPIGRPLVPGIKTSKWLYIISMDWALASVGNGVVRIRSKWSKKVKTEDP